MKKKHSSSSATQAAPRSLSFMQVALLVIFACAAFLRLWNFRHTLQFLGDQGRDAIVVKHIIKDADLVFIGPVTSTGNMYLGPLYYYFMAPFLALSYPSPLGPAYAVAGLGILTVILMYYFGKEIFGEQAALLATFFFAFSATVITYTRFSWNPNPAPLFSLVLLWAVYRAIKKNPWYWVLASACIAVLIQLHYITLLTIPATFLFWAWQARQMITIPAKENRQRIRDTFIMSTLVAIMFFILSLSPLMLFDWKHNWLNVHSLQNFIVENRGSAKVSLLARVTKMVKETHGRSLQSLFEINIGGQREINTFLVIATLAILVWLVRKESPHRLGYSMLLVYFVVAIAGLSFYQGSVFPHYIAYLFPVTFFIYGAVLSYLSRSFIGKIFVGIFAFGFLWWNAQQLPIQSLGWNIDDVAQTSETIRERVKDGEKYNIVLLSSSRDHYGQNYRYFLVVSNRPPVKTDDYLQADTLFIINEEKVQKDVLSIPIHEIQVFPNRNPTEVYTIPDGPEVWVLKKQPASPAGQ